VAECTAGSSMSYRALGVYYVCTINTHFLIFIAIDVEGVY
jgi:hypothetical protein